MRNKRTLWYGWFAIVTVILFVVIAWSSEGSSRATDAAMSSPKKTPISIYVTGRTGVQPLPEEEEELRLQELMPAVLESDRILKQVASTFVEQYGDELKEWPTEAQAQYDEAKKAWAVANAAAGEVKWFGDNTQKDVDDSVKDLKK